MSRPQRPRRRRAVTARFEVTLWRTDRCGHGVRITLAGRDSNRAVAYAQKLIDRENLSLSLIREHFNRWTLTENLAGGMAVIVATGIGEYVDPFKRHRERMENSKAKNGANKGIINATAGRPIKATRSIYPQHGTMGGGKTRTRGKTGIQPRNSFQAKMLELRNNADRAIGKRRE